jgi:hypothetical protein
VAERLLSGEAFARSENDYDWLGPGVYFWQSNPLRALQYAEERRRRDRASWESAVIGAVIDPGLCLDLATTIGIDHIRAAHQVLVDTYAAGGWELPRNSGGKDRLVRRLDCAAVGTLHDVRRANSEPPIDTIFGVFIEGEPAYPSAGFFEKTHIQVCVCNPHCIRGVFRVPPNDLARQTGAA